MLASNQCLEVQAGRYPTDLGTIDRGTTVQTMFLKNTGRLIWLSGPPFEM
ncbi:hypothetical protein MHI48_04715 [Paenibacillus sp. FSL H7-0942]